MKILLYNAHREWWFGRSVKWWLHRRPWKAKYKYILDGLLNDYVVAIFVPLSSNFFKQTLTKLEIVLWAKLNGLSAKNLKVEFSLEIVKNYDLVFSSYNHNISDLTPEHDFRVYKDFCQRIQGKHLLLFNHYPYNIQKSIERLKEIKFDFFMAENNLSKNSKFFRKYFAQFLNVKFFVVPFQARASFKKEVPYPQRANMALAVGTVSVDMSQEKDFMDFFESPMLQPIRNQIHYSDEGQLNNLIQKQTSHINEVTKKNNITMGAGVKAVRNTTGLLEKGLALYNNIFLHGQKHYHSLDLSSLFNSYKYHIVGEEVVSLPGISFIEGMACGSLYIGLDDPMYEIYGMEPGKHYWSYDGTFSDLLLQIQYLNSVPRLADKIAVNGYELVCSNFRPETVYHNHIKTFVESLNEKK